MIFIFFFFDDGERVLSGLRSLDLIAHALEPVAEGFPDNVFIVDNEDPSPFAHP